MSINQIHVEYIVYRANYSYDDNELHSMDSSYLYSKVVFFSSNMIQGKFILCKDSIPKS
jgi:hypothetical protein